jgi:hypothetical protein
VECQLLLGEAHYELGRFTDAETQLLAAQAAADSEADLAAIVSTRVRNLTWGLLCPDRALRVSRAAGPGLRDPNQANELLAIEARVQVYSGRPAEALRTLASAVSAARGRVWAARGRFRVAGMRVVVGGCDAEAVRCLIVDDSPGFLAAAGRLLQRQGIIVAGHRGRPKIRCRRWMSVHPLEHSPTTTANS